MNRYVLEEDRERKRVNIEGVIKKGREKERERQTDRQTDRDIDSEADRQRQAQIQRGRGGGEKRANVSERDGDEQKGRKK